MKWLHTSQPEDGIQTGNKGQGMIINSGSSTIFASSGEDYAEAARTAALKLDRQIREGLQIA